MGMSIDEAERYLRLMLGGMKYAVRYWEDKDKEESDIEQTNVEAVKTALDTMRKYQKFQDQSLSLYMERLKADLVAMLTEIQLEIEEQKRDELSYQQTWNHPLNVCISIIQQKIDKLKE